MTNFLKVKFNPKEHKRIFEKIIYDSKTKCWIWSGAKDYQGYGQGFYRGRKERIHRLIYAFFNGPIPRGQHRKYAQIDHICKNTSCCNPKHLELVAQKTNIIRSNGITAQNSKKTHCKYGHKLPPYNINKPRKYCKICDSIRHKKRMSGPKRKYWLKKQREATARYNRNH